MTDKIIVHIDPDLRNLIPDFMKNRESDLVTINSALSAGDYETIRILGHSMKGFGPAYGFDVVGDIGRSLEEAAKNESANDIRRLAGELESYIKRIEVVFG